MEWQYVRRSRAEHQCQSCGSVIMKGNPYYRNGNAVRCYSCGGVGKDPQIPQEESLPTNAKKKRRTWIATGFFALSALVYFPSLASVFMLLVAALLAPIRQLQGVLQKYLPRKWMKTVATALLVLLALIAVPATPEAGKSEPSRNVETIVTTPPASPTTIPTEEIAQEPAEETLSIEITDSEENGKDKFANLNLFINKYNSIATNPITDTFEIDISTDSEYYRTEFRLTAYQGAPALKGNIENGTIEIINTYYGGMFGSKLRIYAWVDSFDAVTDLFESYCKTCDPEITEEAFSDFYEYHALDSGDCRIEIASISGYVMVENEGFDVLLDASPDYFDQENLTNSDSTAYERVGVNNSALIATEIPTPTKAPSISESADYVEDDSAEMIVLVPTEDNGVIATETPEDSTFEIHFLDVGQGDAALVLCDGKSMLIDGGESKASDIIYSHLKEHDITHLDYIVATHAHEDHVGGLAGALNFATVDTAFCPVTEYDSKAFEGFVKYLDKQDVDITVPTAGDTFALGSASVEIIGPITATDDADNSSMVLRVVYGDTSFLFTGDADYEEEHDILSAGNAIGSTVLKVGHHGSDDSTSYAFLRKVAPEFAVISVGEENTYGHPTEATLSRLRDAGVTVYRTDLQGDIICTSDGETVSFSVEKNADADTLLPIVPEVIEPTATPEPVERSAVPEGTEYVVNKNTGKFHYPHCSSVDSMKESNKWFYVGTRDDLVSKGYSPCGRCHP